VKVNNKNNLAYKKLIFFAPIVALVVILFISLNKNELDYLQFYLLESDSFYYFTVASEKPFSFDNVYLSSGYHPLWQIILAFFNLVNVGKHTSVSIALLFNLFLLLLSLFIFYKMFYEKILGNSLAVFLIVPGAQFLFLLPTNQQNYLHFFSFLNGMESSLTIIFFTLLIYLLRKENIKKSYLAILLLLIVLNRLDNIFLLFSYSLFKIYKTKKILHKEIVFASIGVSVYLILNKYIFGTYLPISLLNNLSFNFMENYAVIFNTFISNTEYSFNAFNTSIFEHPLFWRIIQAYFPFLFSIYFYFILKKFNISKSFYTELLLFFVILKSGYYIFASSSIYAQTQGQWHFPASFIILSYLLVEYSSDLKKIFYVQLIVKTMFVTLSVNWLFLLIYKVSDNYSKSVDLLEIIYIPVIISLILFFVVTITSLFYSSIFRFRQNMILFIVYFIGFNFIHISHFINSDHNVENYEFFKQRHEINYSLKNIDNYNQKLLSLDYGIVNFYLESEIMNGFIVDSSAFTSSKTESIYDIAYNRGYRYFGSLNYLSDFDLIDGSHFMDDKSFNKYNIKIVYESDNNNFLLFEFTEK